VWKLNLSFKHGKSFENAIKKSPGFKAKVIENVYVYGKRFLKTKAIENENT